MRSGHRIHGTKWLDINKGDADQPEYRARLVGREFKLDKRLDLFAATPPLEFLRYLISRCASSQLDGRCTRIMVQNVKKAYFYADATRAIYVDLPHERAQPGMCAKFNKLLYDTRDAALNWSRAYSAALAKLGFAKGRSSPCLFYHPVRELRMVVHGDDFVTEGPADNLQWLNNEMSKVFSLKTEVLGDGPGEVPRVKVLIWLIS